MSPTVEKTKLMMENLPSAVCQLHFNKMEVGTEATLQENRSVVPEQPIHFKMFLTLLAWNSKAE